MSGEQPATVGIIGAGTMGAGIAQVAAQAGWTVALMDVDAGTVEAAIDGIRRRLDRLVEKGRISPAERDHAASRLVVATGPADLAGAELVIEAIVEDLGVKVRVLGELLPTLPDSCIIATNTSSLSVSAIGAGLGQARRTVGMHFFNPAPLMKLVEVIAAPETAPAVVQRTVAIAESWGKHVARAADVPGFIVNHVARPYYLEAFRILEDGYAAADEIDAAMQILGGFRMGPLALTDLIGQDVNTATTRSVWDQLGKPPLLHPSRLQEHLVKAGDLGRKTGRGVYDHGTDVPAVALDGQRRPIPWNEALRAAVDDFTRRATEETGDETQRYVFARILVAIIVQAALACERGVAERTDIDTALRYGVNYPHGPFAWADRIGPAAIGGLLDALGASTDDDRFAAPASLRVPA